MIVAGNIFFTAAGNFQSMAGAGARNNLVLTGEKDRYAGLFSRSNILLLDAGMDQKEAPSVGVILTPTARAASGISRCWSRTFGRHHSDANGSGRVRDQPMLEQNVDSRTLTGTMNRRFAAALLEHYNKKKRIGKITLPNA